MTTEGLVASVLTGALVGVVALWAREQLRLLRVRQDDLAVRQQRTDHTLAMVAEWTRQAIHWRPLGPASEEEDDS